MLTQSTLGRRVELGRRRRICNTRASHVGPDRPPQPLRHGQGRLGREPARRAVPGAGRGDRRGEDRAAGARARRRDARPRDPRDRRAGRRRDVEPRARARRTPTPSSSASRPITRTSRAWAAAGSDALRALRRAACTSSWYGPAAGRSSRCAGARRPTRPTRSTRAPRCSPARASSRARSARCRRAVQHQVGQLVLGELVGDQEEVGHRQGVDAALLDRGERVRRQAPRVERLGRAATRAAA